MKENQESGEEKQESGEGEAGVRLHLLLLVEIVQFGDDILALCLGLLGAFLICTDLLKGGLD